MPTSRDALNAALHDAYGVVLLFTRRVIITRYIVVHTSNLIDELLFFIYFSEHGLRFGIFLSKTVFHVFKITPNV